MEGRDRQVMALSQNTSSEHKRKWKQLSRWERIRLVAEDKSVIFTGLLRHINAETLSEAFNAIDGSKALGVDGVSKATYGKNLEGNLANLARQIKVGSYKPQKKREVLIPKGNGQTRPIVISCFEDKLVEWVIGKILEQVYEPLFIRNSFGFRPNKSAHQAIEASYYSLKEGKRSHVVEIDFTSCFNSIPHRELIKLLFKRISEDAFIGLIGRFLKVGCLNQLGDTVNPEAGTPQGSIMSPILANIYLDEVIDQWFLRTYGSYSNILVRYADDAVFFFHKKEIAEQFVSDLEERVDEFRLTLNADKTKLVDFGKDKHQDFDFLGFTFYWGRKPLFGGRRLKIKTAKKTLHKKIEAFESWIKSRRSAEKLTALMKTARIKLLGHYRYYGYVINLGGLNHFYFQVTRILFKWLNRRSQKPSFDWVVFERKLKQFAIPPTPPMANLRILGWSPYV